MLALSEYVPGTHVLVGGRVAESEGLLKHWTDANKNEALGLNSYALKCEKATSIWARLKMSLVGSAAQRHSPEASR